MSNDEMREWLVPIYRMVQFATQQGTMRVDAASADGAIHIARSALTIGDLDFVEWEPVSEIDRASSPEMHHDIGESDVLPVDDTPPPLRSRYPDVRVTLPRGAAEALMALATRYLKDVGVVFLDPADVAAAQHHLQLGLMADDTARALREPIAAEAGQ
ncbi:MAG: hypothetical protein ACK5VI_09335 [Opitutia bacterium]